MSKKGKTLRRAAVEAGLDPVEVGTAALSLERAAGPHGAFLERRGLLDPRRLADDRALIERIRAKNPRPPGVIGKGGGPSTGLRAQVYERDHHRCVICHSPSDLTLDHWIPRSKGGRGSLANFRTMCKGCNHRKGNMLPEDFLTMDGAPGKHQHRMALLAAA